MLFVEQPLILGKVIKTDIDQGGYITGQAVISLKNSQPLTLDYDFMCTARSEFDCEKFNNLTQDILAENKTEAFFDKVSSERTLTGLLALLEDLQGLGAQVDLSAEGLLVKYKSSGEPISV